MLHRPEIPDRGAGEQRLRRPGQDVGGEIVEPRRRRMACDARTARVWCASRSRRAASAAARRCPCRIRGCRPQLSSSPARFIATIVGSSRNRAEVSGEPPIRSPAETVTLCGWPARSCLERAGEIGDAARRNPHIGCPVRRFRSIVLCGGSRLPWKSLRARICTSTGAAALAGGGGAAAIGGGTAAQAASSGAIPSQQSQTKLHSHTRPRLLSSASNAA